MVTLVPILISHAQENALMMAGFHYKPIFPSIFFGTGTQSVTKSDISFSISQKYSWCAGMLIRRKFNKRFSVESGINYVKRNFMLVITDLSFTGKSDFTIVGYEIPVQLLIFLQASKRGYLNTSMGLSTDMYASNIRTSDSYFIHNSRRNGTFHFSALANLGYEYRTEKSGCFYIGSSYHLPFKFNFQSTVRYIPKKEIVRMNLRGNYISFDFRYYFHEDPIKSKKK